MRSGFVSIMGRPNVGKSTLLNALLSKKVSIVTPKSQTTRDDILGVYNEKDLQIVFIDTPGLFEGEERLYKSMYSSSRRSLSDVDALIFVIDASDKRNHQEDIRLLTSIKLDKPIAILLNKIDLCTAPMMEETKNLFKNAFPSYTILESSAKENFGLKEIKTYLKDLMPEGLPFFPEEVITDKDKPFMAKETIREALLRFLKQEIPHECAVKINSFHEDEGKIEINATIVCEKDTQKRIIIGKGGEMIKKISMAARHNMEKMWGKKVTLFANVEVMKGWRNDLSALAKLGYGQREDD